MQKVELKRNLKRFLFFILILIYVQQHLSFADIGCVPKIVWKQAPQNIQKVTIDYNINQKLRMKKSYFAYTDKKTNVHLILGSHLVSTTKQYPVPDGILWHKGSSESTQQSSSVRKIAYIPFFNVLCGLHTTFMYAVVLSNQFYIWTFSRHVLLPYGIHAPPFFCNTTEK